MPKKLNLLTLSTFILFNITSGILLTTVPLLNKVPASSQQNSSETQPGNPRVPWP